jgi:hypothetical protein
MFVADAVAIFRTFNLVGAGTLVGIVIAEAVIILPLVRSFPSFEGVGALRFAGARAWRLAPACGAVAWISGIVIAVLWPWHRLTLSAALTVAGDVLMGAAVAVTYGPYVTIDKCLRGSLRAMLRKTSRPCSAEWRSCTRSGRRSTCSRSSASCSRLRPDGVSSAWRSAA